MKASTEGDKNWSISNKSVLKHKPTVSLITQAAGKAAFVAESLCQPGTVCFWKSMPGMAFRSHTIGRP